jgi:hypothetical protein
MELVHGVPITQYCDDNRLTPWQRVELFVPVCRAIQHAHQKGIIHRDRPSAVPDPRSEQLRSDEEAQVQDPAVLHEGLRIELPKSHRPLPYPP